MEDLFDQLIERLHALDEIHFKNLFIDMEQKLKQMPIAIRLFG